MLVFAPLIRGGNRPLALLCLELAAVLLAVVVFRKPDFRQQLSRPFQGLLLLMVLLPVVQLIPLPFDLWSSLPGHTYYAQALTTVGGQAEETSRAISLVPFLTEFSGLVLLPPLMVFLFTVGLPREKLQKCVPIFLGLAAFQALLGLVQYGDGPQSAFRLGWYESGAVAVGTYANRDHLAGLLEMALPLVLAMLAARVGRSASMRRHARSLRQRMAVFASTYLNSAAIYGALFIAVLLGLVFTQSRTGVFLGMLGILLSMLAFSTRLGGRNVHGMIGSIIFIGASLAVEIGLIPVLNRFVHTDPLEDARWSIYASVTTAIGEFFPLGSGIGTFNQAYPRFHAPDLNGMFINRAHNDYLEWIMEGGIVAALLILGFLFLYLVQWFRVWKRGEWTTFNFIQVGAGIGLLAMILHTFVDFNLHIPANQIFLAFLAALFFHRSSNKDNDARPAKAHPFDEKADARPESKSIKTPPRAHPDQPGPNPFV